MNLKINNEQKIHVKLNPVTAGGHPATLDGTPTWEVLVGDATVVPDADGYGAYLVSGDVLMDSQFRVTADADLGEGIETLSDTIVLTVIAPNASALGLTADAAESK